MLHQQGPISHILTSRKKKKNYDANMPWLSTLSFLECPGWDENKERNRVRTTYSHHVTYVHTMQEFIPWCGPNLGSELAPLAARNRGIHMTPVCSPL